MAVKIDPNGLCRRTSDYSNSKTRWALKRENNQKEAGLSSPESAPLHGIHVALPIRRNSKGKPQVCQLLERG